MIPGNHKARAVDFDFGFSGTGTEQIAVCFEVVDGDCQGEHITWYGYFSEKTQERTVKALRDLGWAGDNLSTMRLDEISEEVFLVVREEPDQEGNQRLRVAFINKNNSSTVVLKSRMTDQQKQAFASRMRGLCMHIQTPSSSSARAAAGNVRPPSQSQTKPQAPRDRQPGEDLDDGMPF